MQKYVQWNFFHEMDRNSTDEFHQKWIESQVFSASIDSDAYYYLQIVPCAKEDEGSCVVDSYLARHIWRCVQDTLGAGHMRMCRHLDFSSLEEFLAKL